MKKYGPFSRQDRRIIKKIIRRLEFQSSLDGGCGRGVVSEELQAEFPRVKPYVLIIGSAIELARGASFGRTFLCSGYYRGVIRTEM